MTHDLPALSSLAACGKRLAGALLVSACGGVVDVESADASDNREASSALDTSVDDVVPEACASLGLGPGFDSCCAGTYCNGFCSAAPYSACGCGTGESGGCPKAERCCWQANGFRCTLPSDCVTCARVGLGKGIESCCYEGANPLYCRGRCGDSNDPTSWCTCGSGLPNNPLITGGCPWNQLCCPRGDGGSLCIADHDGGCP